METTTQNEQRQLLKRFLSQYYRAKDRQATLRARLASLQAELRHPGVKVPPPDGVPSKTGVSNGAASLTLKIADIEDRIQKQIEIEARSVIAIMDVIEFLPADTIERDILEFRHIDCKPWDKIMDCVHLSRSPCFEYYNKALDKLLTYKKVRRILSDYKERLDREARDTY